MAFHKKPRCLFEAVFLGPGWRIDLIDGPIDKNF